MDTSPAEPPQPRRHTPRSRAASEHTPTAALTKVAHDAYAESLRLLAEVAQERTREADAALEQAAAARRDALSAQDESCDARQAVVAAQAELAGVRERCRTLQEEREALDRRIHDLRTRQVAAEAATMAAEGVQDEATQRHEEARAQAAALRAANDRLRSEAESLREDIASLERQRDQVASSFRPLLPYSPPVDRPRGAMVDTQLNTRLELLDVAALRSQAGGRKGDLKRLLTLALRNYLDAWEYEHALAAIRSQLRDGLTPLRTEPDRADDEVTAEPA